MKHIYHTKLNSTSQFLCLHPENSFHTAVLVFHWCMPGLTPLQDQNLIKLELRLYGRRNSNLTEVDSQIVWIHEPSASFSYGDHVHLTLVLIPQEFTFIRSGAFCGQEAYDWTIWCKCYRMRLLTINRYSYSVRSIASIVRIGVQTLTLSVPAVWWAIDVLSNHDAFFPCLRKNSGALP